MPEETQGTQGTQGTPENPGGAPEANGALSAEDLATIKAELDQEKQANANLEKLIGEKDAAIGDLEAKLSEATKGSESANTELTSLKDAHSKAVARYLEVTRTANPTIPGDVIAGATIEEIDASVAKALSIAGAVKANLEAQAKEARVPAGAPPRTEIPLEGLSPREKIIVGIKQKGGTT